jgi:hypothetical protein
MYQQNIQDVNRADATTTMNSAAATNVETGVWLLCKEFLVTAIQDRRLERGHLRVLAAITTLVNRSSAKAWPSRELISGMTGMKPRSVSNALSELRKWGYLIGGRELVPEAGNRKLMCYTFGNIDHDTIRSEITKFCLKMQGQREVAASLDTGIIPPITPLDNDDTSPPTVRNTSPDRVTNVHRIGGTSPPTVKKNKKTSPHTVTNSSPHTVPSNSIEGTPESNLEPNLEKQTELDASSPKKPPKKKSDAVPQKRGTRLSDDWQLPKSWGQWAMENFQITDGQVRSEADQFSDYWTSRSGQGACKIDWKKVWRNWIRNSKKNYRPRLSSDGSTNSSFVEPEDPWAEARRERLERAND